MEEYRTVFDILRGITIKAFKHFNGLSGFQIIKEKY